MSASSRAVASAGTQEPSNALFRLMAEQWPHPVLVLERDLRSRWANSAAATWLGAKSRDALTGRSWAELSLPWTPDSDGFRQALAGTSARLPEAVRVTADRERRLCRAQLMPLREAAGTVSAILCVIEDLTLTADTTAGMPSLAVLAVGVPVTDTQRQLALSSAQVGSWHWDFDTGYFAVDSRWCKAIHIDPCAGPDHLERWAREIHPDDVVEFRRRRADIENGRADRFEVEYRILTGDSRWLWVLQRGRTIEHRPGGRAARVTGICIDIDDRKRAEVTVQENESRLATALWGARAAFWQWHIPTDSSIMSPLWFAMTGYSREQWESLPDPWTTRVHPDDRAQVAERIRVHLRGEAQSIEVEYRIRTASGEYKWILMRGRVVEWDFDGKPTSAIGVSLDIDAQKRAEVELLSSEARLETAVWGAGMGLWELDFRLERTRWFSDWCDRLDIDPCDGSDHVARWDANLHPDDVGEAARRFADHVAGKEDYYDAEYRVRTRKGQWRWLFERGRVVERAADGSALRMVGVCLDIDSRKESEILSGKSQRRLEVALESARGGMWDMDTATGIVHRTDYFYRMLGVSPEAARGGPCFWTLRIHPDDRPRVEAAVADVIEGRTELYEAEYRLQHTDGTWRWVLDRGRASERADGKATRMVGFMVDITDRVHTQETRRGAEEALRKSEAVLRAVTGNTPDWLFLLDEQLCVRFMNRRFRARGVEDVVGRSLLEILPEEDRAEVEQLCRRVFAGEPNDFEQHFIEPDGTRRSFEARVRAVHADDRIVGAVLNLTDVTERQAQQVALRTQARILETMREGVVLVDSQSRVRLTNPAFDAMFGYHGEELLGQPVASLVGLQAMIKARLERYGTLPVEFECGRRDGSRFMASCLVTPLTMGGADYWLAVVNDVTERKRLESEIIGIANREQQRIGSDLHDGLGQDLTGIALMLRGIVAQLRKESSATRLDVEDVINLVNNAIESTRALARGLSPVSAEQGGLPAALQTLAAKAGERYGIRVNLRTDLVAPLQLPDATATHLYRIAQEALTNVVRHSRASEVTIELEAAEGELQLRIGDNGKGFRPPTEEPIGLGLKIMRYRAQMLGGDLLLETKPDGGTLVRCICPLSPAEPTSTSGRHRRVPS